jgi:hypothetical protein
MFNCPFVVINEKPAKVDKRGAVFPLEKFKCTSERVSSAASKLSLVLDGRTERAYVNGRRERWRYGTKLIIKQVAVIREVRHPSITRFSKFSF